MHEERSPFVAVRAGDTVFREGDPGSDMFIIETGTVDIVRRAQGSQPIATLEAGDFFGEMAILEDQPRFASALARTDCRLLRIDRAAFGNVLAQNIEIAIRIMRKLTARLRRSELRLLDLPVAQPDHRVAAPSGARGQPAPAGSGWSLYHAGAGQRFALAAGSESLIGRPDPVTGIYPQINLGPLDVSRSLSRRHAKISPKNGAWVLCEEIGSTNGTFLNGIRLKTGESVALQAGDRIRFGSVEMELQRH